MTPPAVDIGPILLVLYCVVAGIVIVGLQEFQVLRWQWKPPPSYVRVVVGVLWGPIVLALAGVGIVLRIRNRSRSSD